MKSSAFQQKLFSPDNLKPDVSVLFHSLKSGAKVLFKI